METLHTVIPLTQSVYVPAGAVTLQGDLVLPDSVAGLVLFVHGSGSSRHSPRNKLVAQELHRGNVGTLLFDLLTHEEEAVDLQTAELRFDIDLLARRVAGVTRWLKQQPRTRELPLGYFGAGTGAAAALVAAAEHPKDVAAVVSRGGRPDLAIDALGQVQAPTLLIVGGEDLPVIGMNKQALGRLQCEKELRIIPGATHLFEEPGTLELVATDAKDWFVRHLR